MLPTLRSVPIVLAAAGLLAPAAANAATKVAYPSVDSISPRKLAIGDTLTIKGKNLRAGAGKTTVVFQRSGKPAVFVKAISATKRRIALRVPEKLQAFLVVKDGAATPTAFRLRVLTTRFAKTWTSVSRSPVIAPKAAAGSTPGTGAAPQPTPYELCQLAAKADPAADADKDGLSNGTELGLVNPTDSCNADSDADGMVDGYEYFAAIDLNGTALPYPGKRPWPNPLDGTDGTYDFDGDGISLSQEYTLWKYVGGTFPLTAYSDGRQSTNGPLPAAVGNPLDLDADGNLSDDERDADGDGLSNMVEMNLSGTVTWWQKVKVYEKEKPYTRAKFVEPVATEPDTDGDGVPDGADDQDHDGFDNVEEMQYPWRNHGLRVQPFNPCLPDPYSLTCSRWLVVGTDPWPPFDGSEVPFDTPLFPGQGSVVPFTSPDTLTSDPTLAWNGNGGPQGS
jgi:hypothetical protein